MLLKIKFSRICKMYYTIWKSKYFKAKTIFADKPQNREINENFLPRNIRLYGTSNRHSRLILKFRLFICSIDRVLIADLRNI